MNTPIDELYERIPHVDREWAEHVITELAIRDVSGADIGAAMLEVESHMAERGGDVREAFGDPKAYAAALELPDTGKLSRSQWTVVWLPAILMFAGMSVLLNGVLALLGGGGLSLTPVGIVLVVLVVGAVAFVRFNLLRLMVEHPVLCGVVLFVLIGSLGALASLVPGPTLDVAPSASIPGGGLLLASGLVVLAWLRRRAEADGVTFPNA